jgi:hypothetical protein
MTNDTAESIVAVWPPDCEESESAFEYELEWDYIIDHLTELMNEKNPDGYWYAKVSNFGWRHLDGNTDFFNVDNGTELLRKVLPDTDCSFTIYDEDYGFRINNAHHDAPMGGEIYNIVILKDCAYCQQLIRVDILTDETGGDCCEGDDELNNENEVHKLLKP